MANRKITEHGSLTGASSASTDVVEVVDISDTSDGASGTNKKMTLAELATAVTTHGSLATDSELTSHASDTTSIHGIADTSALETATGAQTKVDTHVNDTTAAHAASAISVDSTNLDGVGTNVQTVLEELEDTIDGLSLTFSGDAGDVPFTPVGTIAATDTQAAVAEVATDAAAALAAHEADTTSIHGISNTANLETTTGAQTKVDTHVNDTTAAHAASAVSVNSTNLSGVGTDVQAVVEELDNTIDNHIADAADAHDASAISFSPTGSIAATDVQAAIAEVAAEASGGSTAVWIPFYISDPNGSDAVTGDSQVVIAVPPGLDSMVITDAYLQMTTTGASTATTVQLHRRRSAANVDVFSTKPQVDAAELNSTTGVAAVINGSNDDLATGDELHADVDTVGTGVKGLTLWIEVS